jgi:hypothetical protein
MDNKAYICQCCGGTINRDTMKCEYCGTEYEKNDDQVRLRIETFQNPVETLACQVGITDEDMIALGPEEASKLAMQKMCRQLSECLAPFINMRVEHDPCTRIHHLEGRLKIVRPVNHREDIL